MVRMNGRMNENIVGASVFVCVCVCVCVSVMGFTHCMLEQRFKALLLERGCFAVRGQSKLVCVRVCVCVCVCVVCCFHEVVV